MPVVFAAGVDHASVMPDLLIMLAAKSMAEVFERLRQPAVPFIAGFDCAAVGRFDRRSDVWQRGTRRHERKIG